MPVWNPSAKEKDYVHRHSEKIMGYIYISLSYLLWGFLALYWNALDTVSSMEILAHRILWGFIFVVIIMACQTKKRRAFFKLFKEFKVNFKQFSYIFVASLAISANWLIFIWAVNFGYIMEASLGLYITPIVSMVLGVLIVKDNIRTGTLISMIMAFLGVLVITYEYGKIPWVAISLAMTSGIYGLTKKYIKTDTLVGMCIETIMVIPFALLFLVFIQRNNKMYFGSDIHLSLLLISAGILTVLPLLWFTEGSKRMSLTTIGFFQYITPTITFLLGVFIFENTITLIQWISFSFIWLSLAVFSFSSCKGITKK
ncbi:MULTISPECIES: EamA family transporter RarD [Bacillaceae]|uniref:Chloramphenicol-sensitive protein RarD n=1 Tax=Peribacillus huizhouensis TaxID=1501239 RepID=A0ABR6CI47_9BACI|nr:MULTISPECIES: EamA family transporter RarD [Bacillaceae]MBA9024721.1 chloramphenicol-sensitive protein RarD [Peribacillus huizhouensis]